MTPNFFQGAHLIKNLGRFYRVPFKSILRVQIKQAIVSNLTFINPFFLDIKVHTVLLLKLSMMMRLIQITKTIVARPQQPIAVLPDMKLDLILTKVNQKMPVQTTIKIKETPTEQAEIQVQVKNFVQPFVLPILWVF